MHNLINNVLRESFEVYHRSGTAITKHSLYTHQMAALFCVKWRHGRHLEIMASYQKSNWCVFTWNTNHTWSNLKRRSLRLFLNRSPPTRKENEKRYGISFWLKKEYLVLVNLFMLKVICNNNYYYYIDATNYSCLSVTCALIIRY